MCTAVTHANLSCRYSSLKQNNLHKLEEYLTDVSHPESPNYGQHWSAAEVAKTFAPDPTTIDAVRAWLNESFAPERIRLSPSRGWLDVNATTAEVEALLDAEYHVYSHELGGEHIGPLFPSSLSIYAFLYDFSL